MEKNKKGPCLEKNCSWCCDPVKVNKFFPDNKIPRDKNGNKIWESGENVLVPENDPGITKLETFKCKNFDKETGRCLDYENRPDICKNTSCIKNPDKSIGEQHKEVTEQKFIKIKKGLYK